MRDLGTEHASVSVNDRSLLLLFLFLHERQNRSTTRKNMCPDIDFMDPGARKENLHAKGEPMKLQLCVVPAYSLTVR